MIMIPGKTPDWGWLRGGGGGGRRPKSQLQGVTIDRVSICITHVRVTMSRPNVSIGTKADPHLKRFCGQGWGRNERKGHFTIFKGEKTKKLALVSEEIYNIHNRTPHYHIK